MSTNMSNNKDSKIRTIWKHLLKYPEFQFGLFFIPIFILSFTVLYIIGFVPSEFQEDTSTNFFDNLNAWSLSVIKGDNSVTTTTDQNVLNNAQNKAQKIQVGDIPLRVVIIKSGTDIVVRNPNTTDVDYLDQELSKGVVHYPGSGTPGSGNMFLFGHSTGFKIVNNKAYKAFNGLDKLAAGDIIDVYSSSTHYVYKVRTVVLQNENNSWVDFDKTSPMLTLSTCDSFGKKTDRYVVQADFVDKSPII